MTGARREHVIGALVALGPGLMDNALGPGHHRCVLSTYLGEAVLKQFGIRTERWPCEIVVRGVSTFVAVATAKKPEGALEVGPGDGYAGHLVVLLPDDKLMLDLDLGQFHHPLQGIVVPKAAAFEWREPGVITYHLGPTQIEYGPHPEPEAYRRNDWSPETLKRIFAPLVNRIVHAIKEAE